MKLVGVLMALAVASAACTKANPRSCKDGSCTDPTLPFCDVTGAIAGDPQTCIAPSCTPGDFAECRGATAVTCNASGDDYDLVSCPRGCDDASQGCTKISCTPGTFSECQGDSEVVCNLTGDDYGLIPCEHGCAAPTGCQGISCTPNEFSMCQGNDALACNDLGNNYVLEQCEHGCDPTSGCRECEPNVATCSNNTLMTCDSTGHTITPSTCDLGCATSEPRCRVIVPSNGVGTFADSVTSPPALQLVNPVFDTADGSVTVGGTPMTVPTTLLAAGANGVALRVWVVDSLEITNASIVTTGNAGDAPGPAAAIVAKGDLTIHGGLTVQPRVGQAGVGCDAGGGMFLQNGMFTYATGGGGGGNATIGGLGGKVVMPNIPPAASGHAVGAASLVPLQGGCSGGIDVTGTSPQRNGAGALQLTSYTTIHIEGLLDLAGADGTAPMNSAITTMHVIGGGGGGGSLLVEALQVELATTANIETRGGDGGSCTPRGSTGCTAGGAGATSSTAAAHGVDLVSATTGMFQHTGGGGGGLGRLRINTATGQYTSAPGAVVDATATMGTVQAQ